LKAWKREKKKIIGTSFYIMFFKKEISIKKATLLKALKFPFIEYHMNFNAIDRLLSKVNMESNPIFISNRTFGEDIILVNNLANRFKGKHFNYQAVAMSIMWYPQIKLADKFYMYTKASCDFYRKLDSSYNYYLPIFNIGEVSKLKNTNFLTVSIFTQPDSLTPRYLNLLYNLDRMIKENGVKNIFFKIKTHYRQNDIKSFKNIVSESNCFELVDVSVSPSELMEQSDFTLSMTSSVLFEAVQLNCPAIVFNLNGINKSFVEINCVPEVNFVVENYHSLLNILNKPIQYKELYFIRRNDFIAKNKSDSYKSELLK
jgi:hypothetical protein